MPACAEHTAFGAEDFKIDGRFLSSMAFLCSPDKPVETSTVIGSYAVNEICVSDAETADIKMYLGTLRSAGQAAYVRKVAAEIRLAARAEGDQAAAEAADAMEAEFCRLKKVFFPRVRSFIVVRVDTGKSVGRIVTFPDQISDDYGNNLEERSEQGFNQHKVNQSHVADALKTVYMGHGQGSALAQVCACASGRQVIVFDGTTLSDLLVHNAVQHKCVKLEPLADDEAEEDWHIIHYRTEASAKRQDAAAKAIITAAHKIDAEEKAAAEAAKEAEAKLNGDINNKAAAEEEEDNLAEEWLKKCEWNTIGGIIPAVAQNRFLRTGRYNAKALSDMMVDHTVLLQASHDPYA
ncbi:hypothetical protein JKF63_03016 [Porcisia hertigi]|uniref:Uncharacterized protein n=1 Tax=Porcisia hertigi TaxID=2761500 RepID=A0A836LFX6_9TRYP|nr:hypothetical protein JKF63_03016 [Porcisia hertigi]